MSIEQKPFDNESELHKYVEKNISTFFGKVHYFAGNFLISTKRDKGAKPDGFILDLSNSSWTIIESELLKHGVWDHIAEQLVRFIVASQNPVTKKKIRDYFFEKFDRDGTIPETARKLKIPEAKLMQRIENILENNLPDIALFIDDVNEDLEDMVEALNASVRVFKIQKYMVSGVIEYLSPQGTKSTIEVTVEDVKDVQAKPTEVLDLLGGGKWVTSDGRVHFYSLKNGDKIALKVSKFYEAYSSFWFGLTPETMRKYEKEKITHVAFVLAKEGVVKVPFKILKEYLKDALTTLNQDKSVRHYHVYIVNQPRHQFYINKKKPTWDLEEYFFPFG